jgi:Zn-finger nucleic acid-binding protein
MASRNAVLRCPDDGQPLLTEAQGDVPFAICEYCHGLWFERAAIERRDDARAAIPRASARLSSTVRPRTARSCPACREHLAILEIDGIEIDRCRRCGGVWLDPGEYDAARIRLKRSPSVPPRPPNGPNSSELFEVVAFVVEVITTIASGFVA